MPVNFSSVVQSYDLGQNFYSTWRKVPTQTTASGFWFDISMSPGNPPPQYYAAAPQVSIALTKSADGGLNHGPTVSPKIKYLHKILVMAQTTTAVPLPMILLDYLMFYPFVPMDSGDSLLTTSISLPRYPTGIGVQILPVLVAAQTGGTQFYCTYTNQDGVAGRVTPVVTCNSQSATGTIITSASATSDSVGPFMPLQAGDTGVRSIEMVTNLTGDVGLISFVLVKPLVSTQIFDITAPVEIDYLTDRNCMCPNIVDDAFLNFIVLSNGTLASAPINGEIHTFWS
jgi:hypothetical protein